MRNAQQEGEALLGYLPSIYRSRVVGLHSGRTPQHTVDDSPPLAMTATVAPPVFGGCECSTASERIGKELDI